MSRLWIFDFDGTISNLVEDRKSARLNSGCARMIETLVNARGGADRIAILSSRTLEDLERRVNIAGVYLGGSHGIVWQFPGGERRKKEGEDSNLQARRRDFLPKISIIEKYPGIEIEDKEWSVAIHLRRASEPAKREVRMILEDVSIFRDFRKLYGPEVIEIPLLHEMDKASGIRNLCEFLDYEPEPGGLIYAGDDENDIPAMQWVLFLKGTVFTVGLRPLVTGSKLVGSPKMLAGAILDHAAGLNTV